MTPDPALLIRCDADSQIGVGHVMRCLALAQAWQDTGGRVTFQSAPLPYEVHARVLAEDCAVRLHQTEPGRDEDSAALIKTAKSIRARWVVIDGYHFDAHFQKRLKDAGLSVLALDDYGHAEFYHADIVLNQNVSAAEALYARRSPSTTLLLGARYAMLRREFLDWAEERQTQSSGAHKILVTLGGADPPNMTQKVLEAIHGLEIPDIEIVAVIGSANPHLPALQAWVEETGASVRLEQSSRNMAEHMLWADVAFSAGGSTCYELAYMGVPALVAVLAENQRPVAEELHRRGAIVNMGRAEEISVPQIAGALQELLDSSGKRDEMIRAGQSLIDGLGATRVLTRMNAPAIRVRQAGLEDCRIVWEWVNDPVVRRASFDSSTIAWENHERWFHAALSDDNILFLIAESADGQPIAAVRFQTAEVETIISIGIAASHRGKGLGAAIIRSAAQYFFASSSAHTVYAFIKTDNAPSLAVFYKAGFGDPQPVTQNSLDAVRLSLTRDTFHS